MKKRLLSLILAAAVCVSVFACGPGSKEQPKTTLSVANITLKEGEVKDIAVTFSPADKAEDYTYSVTSGAALISIRNNKVTGLSEGTADVKVTTSPSNLTATFKVTVTPDETDPIAKFAEMGGFEAASLKELGWTESSVGAMAPAGDNKRAGDYALKLYGGWDGGTSTNLTFDYTLSTELKRVPAGDYTLSYQQKGTVNTVVKVNGQESARLWLSKDAAGWENYIVYISLAAKSNLALSFQFIADEDSDNETERWAVIDEMKLISGKSAAIDIKDKELDLNADGDGVQSVVIDSSAYTVYPVLAPVIEISEVTLSAADTNSVTIDDKTITAKAVGQTEITVSYKAFGVARTQKFIVKVIDTAQERGFKRRF